MIQHIYKTKFSNRKEKKYILLPQHKIKFTNSEESMRIDDINKLLDEISNDDHFIGSLKIIANQSNSLDVCRYLHESEADIFIFERICSLQNCSDRLIIYYLQIMNNILSLTGNEIIELFLYDFQDIFQSIITEYFSGPSKVVSIIFDTFLAVMRPPTDISFFISYLSFFITYLKIPNPCKNKKLTTKSFQCCNKMFNLKQHQELQSIMLEEEGIIEACYIHMKRKTQSFSEACSLLGHIGHLNRYIIDKLEDDFFTYVILRRISDDNDDIVASTMMVCNSLATNDSICNLLIEEKPIFNSILSASERGFTVKECSIDLLSTLFEKDSIYLMLNLIEYGTLDFFVNYLEAEDDDITSKVLQSLNNLISHFVIEQTFSGMPPPFVEVLQNSQELIDFLNKLSFDENVIEKIRQASTSVYHQCLGEEEEY